VKVQASRKSFLALESVAMTDIVMNLFIFFFISFSLLYTFNPNRTQESRIEVKLPEGAAAGAQSGSPLVVFVTAGNEIFIGDRPVRPDALLRELAKRAKTDRPSGVVVKADRAASVETLVRVLDAARQAGLRKLGVAIATR